MRKSIILLFAVVILISACEEEEALTAESCSGCTFEIYSDVAMEVGLNATNTVSVIPAEKLLFRFTRPVFNESSESTETRAIIFEVDNDRNSFNYSGDDILKLFPHEGIDTDGLEGPLLMNFARDILIGSFEGQKINDDQWSIGFRDVDTGFGKQTVKAVFKRI